MISTLLDSWVLGVRSELKNLGFAAHRSSGLSTASGTESESGSANRRSFGPAFAIVAPIIFCQLVALGVFLVAKSPKLAPILSGILPINELQIRKDVDLLTAVTTTNPGELDAAGRVQQMEQQLRLKVSQLDAVIREARELDPSIPTISWSDTTPTVPGTVSEPDARDGVGEGDEREIAAHLAPRRLSSSADSSEGLTGRLGKLNLSDALDQVTRELKSIPIGFPVDGKLSSGFGARVSPFSHSVKMHYGVDLSIDRETPVLATADGVVVNTGYEGGFGRVVVVDHGNGMTTLFSHLARSTVAEGERICRGEIVGHVGASGKATGPHLHYEVHIDGKPQNPVRYLNLASLVNLL